MYSYFSNSEDQCLAAMKKAVKEALDSELGHSNTMKNIPQAYKSKGILSVQEPV